MQPQYPIQSLGPKRFGFAPMDIGKIAKLIALPGGPVLGFIIAVKCWSLGVSPQGAKALAILIGSVAYWITGVFEDYVTALLMGCGWVLTGVVPIELAFSAFAGPTWWLVAGALGLGVAVARSGLLRRAALYGLCVLPENFFGQSLGLALTGLVASPLLPSAVGKMAIGSRFVEGISDVLNIKRQTSQFAGLFFSIYWGLALSVPLFLTSSPTNLIVLQMLPDYVKDKMSWGQWFFWASCPMVFMLVFCFTGFYLIFRPTEGEPLSKSAIKQELLKLGEWTRTEIITLIVLFITLVLWITQPLHKIEPAIATILALISLLALGVLDRTSLNRGVNWTFLLYFGLTMNIGVIFQVTDLGEVFGNLIFPLLEPFNHSPFLLLLVLCTMVLLLRFVFVSYNALIIILMASIIPLSSLLGVHPWVIGFVLHLASASIWLMPYQHQIFSAANKTADGDMVSFAQSFKASVVSIIGMFGAVIVGVLFWSSLGLI